MASVKRPASVDAPSSSPTSKQARVEGGDESSGKNNDIIIVTGTRKGERPEMQDRHSIDLKFDCGVENLKQCILVCLFDGHAGARASQYCNQSFDKIFTDHCHKYSEKKIEQLEKSMKRIFIEVYKKIDDAFLVEARRVKPPLKDGSTATTLFILNNTIYSANIGDSQAILCRKKPESDEFLAMQLTADHSPLNFEERSRIQKAGGNVHNGRLLGILEVSRAFGDGQLKAHGLISTPAVKRSTIADSDLFVICGSDGLWKVFKPMEAIQFVREKYLEKRQNAHNLNELFENIAGSLAAESVLRGSGDNVSVIIVVFTNNLSKI